MATGIRVVLADDHAMVRAGLRALLSAEGDIEVVGEASNGMEALEAVKALRPDVVVLDIVMPGPSGLEVAQRVLEGAPECKVVFLTMHREFHYLSAALKLGASGYVLKTDADTELVKAIRAAARGIPFVYSSDAEALRRQFLEDHGHLPDSRMLSEMEERVLRLTVQGYSNAEIAEKLGISRGTVDSYRARGMNKLGLEHRSELIYWALHAGLLTIEREP
ncbi:MAG: response regulator transcription factor [Chloroflexi bacterium]|nr:response regulator transcription factor [Chloroflexota bacterium]